MSTADRQVIAKVKSIEGEVVAISPDGTKRVLMAGDIIYSDEVIDTSKGKILLVQDGDIVLQTDIAAILGQGELTPEEKAKLEKILKDLEGDEKDALAKAKAAQEQIAALGTGEQGQEMHEEPAYNFYKGSTSDVRGEPQVFIGFERPGLTEPTFFNDDTPEIFVPPVVVISPTELRATTLNQLADPTNPNAIGDYFGVLGQNSNVVSQDLSAAFDILMHSHPDAVFAVTVTGNLVDYMAAPLEFPAPIILPYGLGVQPWKVVTGDAPNTISYLYRKEDLNLLSAQAQDSKQELIDSADQHIQSITDVKNVIEQQISGISDLSLDQFEIKANLNACFVVYDNLKNQLQLEINQLTAQKVVADANLTTWENTVHNFGIPLGSITNAAAIASLEASWKVLGGTPETIPGQLENLYAEKAVFDQAINHLDTQILADQHLLNGIVQDVITPLLVLSNFIPTSDADYKQALVQASQALDNESTLAQGYKNALLNALENIDLVLRTGLANDSDFAFKSQVLLVDSISAANPVVVGDIFDQNGGLVNVDALASGLKVELNGDLSHDQTVSISSQFDAITTKLILHLDLKFANPSADENIHIEIPGVPGLNWNLTNVPANSWVLHADNSLTLDLPSTSPLYSSRTGLIDTLELSFPTSLLKNVELNNFTYKILINSEVIPVGDNEINLNNNILNQSFNFDIDGKLPGRGIYFVESESQADALANVEKHASVDIKPLLDNIALYLNILSGPAETNFLNNTKIEFRFFNVDPLEPPKVLFNDGAVHSYDFVKSGDSWILTGQALKDYIDAWNAAPVNGKAYFENPVIIAAPYGAEDMLLKVSGLINGANEVVVQDLVPVVVDAVAQKITADDVDLSNVIFNVDFTKFNLKVNIVAPDGDGSESRLVDIDLTHVFNYTADVPANFNPNWTVFSNNGVWTIDTVSVPGEVHLKGNIQGVVGNSISSELTLGFSTATLEYLPKNGSGNYEIVIGGPAFDVPGTNPAGVISKEIIDNNEKDFNLTDDQIGPVYLKAGTTVEVPASIVIRKEAQVDVPNLNPLQDAYSINIAKALVDIYSSLDASGKAIVNSGVIPTLPSGNAGIDALLQNTKILFLENSTENAQFTLQSNNLFNKLHDYVTAAPVDQAAIGKILYYVGQYEAEVNTVEVKLTDASNTPIITYPDLVGGVILPEKTVVFDAVGSGTAIPELTLTDFTVGALTSSLTLNFNVIAKDITSETVEITITLPNAPNPAYLNADAPSGLTFGWALDASSPSAWSLNGNTLTGTFDLTTLLTTNIISSLTLNFNTNAVTNLNPDILGSNLLNFNYAIHSVDNDAPNTYIISDNQSADLTGAFNINLGNLDNVVLLSTKVNELVWDNEIVKLAFQDNDFSQLLPIPIFKEFIEQFKTAADSTVLFLDSNSLNGKDFTFKIDISSVDMAWGNTKAYLPTYSNSNGVTNFVPIDLVLSPTGYTGTIGGQYLKAIYDAYFNTSTFTENNINYLTNIFVALPTALNLSTVTGAHLDFTSSDPVHLPDFHVVFDPNTTGEPISPNQTFDSTAVNKQAITISVESALDYLYTQLVSGGVVDASRLASSSIVVTLTGVDASNSLVYMVDPNPALPAATSDQVGISPNANNIFISDSTNANEWIITGEDLVQIFTQRFGSSPSNVNPADLPNIGILNQIYSGSDITVKMDVVLNNGIFVATTQNILEEKTYLVDDSSHGAIVNRIFDNGLSLQSTVTYQTDNNEDDQFDGPDTTGGLIGTVKIKFNVDAGILDVNSGEQHYLVIEMFPGSANPHPALPQIQIDSQGNLLNWIEVETAQGSIFIAKIPAGNQNILSSFSIEMSMQDLKTKGYLIDKDTVASNSNPFYTQLNNMAIDFHTELKLYSTLDANYQGIVNGYNTGSLNTVSGLDGLAGNNSVQNNGASNSLEFKYSSVPVNTADDLVNINNTNTFFVSIAIVLNAIHDRLAFLGQIGNDTLIETSNITVTITGKNGVTPTLAGNADLPDGVGTTSLFSLFDGGPTYVLSSTKLLTYYNLWNSPTTTPAEKALLETWFFPPEIGNNRDFTVQVDYKIAGYENIVPIESTLLDPHLVIVRAVADSTVDAALLDSTQPIVHTGEVPALPGGDAPADSAFDFNAADAARFITQLHVKVDFGEPNPNVTRLVEIFIPKSGANPDGTTGNIDLGWKVVPGADNGWQIDYTNDPMHPNQIKLYKLFEPGTSISSTSTGNIDEYVDLSFLMTGVGGFDLRNPGQSAILQYMGLSYTITTITDNVDLGGGLNNDPLSNTVAGTVTQDIIVPSFVGVTSSAPAFTTQNDYYFVSNPDSGLTVNRTITGLGAIVSGSVLDEDAHYDYWFIKYQDVENGGSGYGFNNLRDMLVNNDNTIPSGEGGVPMATNPFPYYADTNLQDQHVPGSNFLLPGDAITDSIYSYISFSWTNNGNIHIFNYSYQLRDGGASSSVTEYGVGRFFEPGEGNDIVIGSDGRDIFKSSQNDFVGGTNTPLLDINGDPVNLGNDVFVGGLGRDWIEGGAGNDVAYSDGMAATTNPYTSAQNADVGGLFLMSGIGSASIYLPKVTDVIATGAGNDIIYTGGSNYDSLSGIGGPNISGHDAVGIMGKDAGVLVFAGSGDNVIFSGKGADIIVLDDTIGITRVVPTSNGFVVPTEFNLENGLHYVYNSNSNIAGGSFAGLFTGTGDAATFTTAQALNANGNLSIVNDYNGSGAGIQNSYLYDIIRPIYDATTDTTLNYSDDSSGATDSDFRTAEHGANTLVYWKDSVSSSANSADVVMYFNVASDKINLTALFDELSPNMTQTDRLAAINLTQITSVTPIDSTSNGFGTASYDPFSTDGREGTRVSVTVNGQNYVVADLANVHTADVNAVKQNVFEVMQAPDAHLS